MPLLSSLPLPASGRISHVVHLGDVHIPFLKQPQQPHQKERLRIHSTVIDRLIRSVASLPSVIDRTAVVLIVGDVLDCRHTANATTVALLNQLIEGLCRVAPVYVTAGNHDILLEEDDASMGRTSNILEDEEDEEGRNAAGQEGAKDDKEAAPGIGGQHVPHRQQQQQVHHQGIPDLLGALLQPMISAGLPVAYIKDTGVYGTPGTGALFGVLHIRDAMVPGNCSGAMRCIDDMPFDLLQVHHLRHEEQEQEQEQERRDAAIFVFHGQVTRLPRPSADDNDCPLIPALAAGCGYDVCMLGDVHSMQLHNMLAVSRPRPQEGRRGSIGPDTAIEVGDDDFAVELFGDDRQQHEHNQEHVPWAYCGSTLQLGACERMFPHGFILWTFDGDLSIRARPYHLPSPFGTVILEEERREGGTFYLHNGIGPLLGSELPTPQPLEHFSKGRFAECFPPKVSLRLVGGARNITVGSLERAATALELVMGTSVVGAGRSGVRSLFSTGKDANPNGIASSPSAVLQHERDGLACPSSPIDLSHFGRPSTWVEYLIDKSDGDEDKLDRWARYLTHPELLSVPFIESSGAINDALPDIATQKLRDRNIKIGKKATEVAAFVRNEGECNAAGPGVVDPGAAPGRASNDTTSNDSGGGPFQERQQPDKSPESMGGSMTARRAFSICTLRWSWILCYGEDNSFDFSSLDGRVALLSAPNGRGKSSMLEVVCLALYGQPMPSRGGKTSLVDVPCKSRRPGSTPSCTVDVALPSLTDSSNCPPRRFRITRSYNISNATGRITTTSRVSKLVAPYDTPVTVKDGSAAVNAWVADNLGSLQSFLLCSLLTQHSDVDFFGMKPAEQRALLDEALALDAVRATCDALKESRLAHAAIVDVVQTAIETAADSARAKSSPAWIENASQEHRSKVTSAQEKCREAEADVERLTVELCSAQDALKQQEAKLVAVDSVVYAGEGQGEEKEGGAGDESASEDEEKEERGGEKASSASAASLSVEEFSDLAAKCATWKSNWPAEWVKLRRDDIEARAIRVKNEVKEKKSTLERTERELESARQALSNAKREFDAAMDRQKCSNMNMHHREDGGYGGDGGEGGDAGEEEDVYALYEKAMNDLNTARQKREEVDHAERRMLEATEQLGRVASSPEDRRVSLSDPPDQTHMRNGEARSSSMGERADWESGRRQAMQHAEQRFLTSSFDIEKGDCTEHQAADMVYASVIEFQNRVEDLAQAEQRVATLLRKVQQHRQQQEQYERRNEQARERREHTHTARMVASDDVGPYDDTCWACRVRKERAENGGGRSVASVPGVGNKGAEGTDRDESTQQLETELKDAETKAKVIKDGFGEKQDQTITPDDKLLAELSTWLRRWRANRYSDSVGASELIKEWTREDITNARTSLWIALDLERRAKDDFEAASNRSKDSKCRYKAAKEKHDSPEEAKRRESKKEEREKREASWRGVEQALESVRACEKQVEDSKEQHDLAKEAAGRVTAEADRWMHFADGALGEEGWAEKRDLVERWRSVWRRRVREMRGRRDEAAKCRMRLENELRETSEDSRRAGIACVTVREEAERHEAFAAKHKAWSSYRNMLDERRSDLAQLGVAMEGFTAWVYARRALPAIQGEVNALLASITSTGSMALVLKGSCGGLDGSGSGGGDQTYQQQQGLAWTLNDTPLTKCSGMQRFAVSLAMRLALAQLGACNVTCGQLMIDEGFGALDANNITSVPEFLHAGILGSGRFSSVLLVSHLEGVREAADVVVPIKGRPGGLSELRYGG